PARSGHHGAALAAGAPLPLAAVPGRVRRGADQAPRRPLLAGPDLPLLPPRDPAHAESAEPVLPPPAPAGAPRRGAGQPLRAAGGALLPLHPPAGGVDRRGRDPPHPGLAGGERELLLAELP